MAESKDIFLADNKAMMPKISDSEMQYYQFKARQRFLLQKEADEWQQFCQQKLSKCSECKANDCSPPKDVGIQTTAKKPLIGKRTTDNSKFQDQQLPLELNFIKTKLEQIDMTLSEMKTSVNDDKIEINKVKVPSSNLSVSETSALDNLDTRRKQLIQNSLKASLQRLQASTSRKFTTSASKIHPKNSSFFLPHDLMAQREISRKAYLASLAKPKLVVKPSQTKKVLKFAGNHQIISNTAPVVQKKHLKDSEKKTVLKSKKKLSLKKEKKNVSTQVETVNKIMNEDFFEEEQVSEVEDENVEHAVDGILDDLLGETVLVLNAIKQKKAKNVPHFVGSKSSAFEEDIACKSDLKIAKMPNSNSLEHVADATEHMKNRNEEETVNILELKNVNNVLEKPGQIPQISSVEKHLQLNKISVKLHKETVPTILSIGTEEAKKIENYRKDFWNHLEKISWVQEGNFNPWILADMIAESIFDDCISDVCQDLVDIPSVFVTELYSRELIQHL